MQIIHAPTLALAQSLPTPTLSVEAEYGSTVVEGSVYTAAHHQPVGSPFAGRHLPGLAATGRPSPCNDGTIPTLENEGTILVSHLDLDTIGGCLRALPEFVDLFADGHFKAARRYQSTGLRIAPADYESFARRCEAFWCLAEWIDVRGAHKLSLAPEILVREDHLLQAWWAWWKGASPRLPRDCVTNVTAIVLAAGEALRKILAHDEALLAAGAAFAAAGAALNARTCVRVEGEIIVRRAGVREDFCNHLYSPPASRDLPALMDYQCPKCGGERCGGDCDRPRAAVACLNTELGSVTISLADPIPGVSCRAIVQALWGPEAGGHDGIAGSPRGRRMAEADLEEAVAALDAAIGGAT